MAPPKRAHSETSPSPQPNSSQKLQKVDPMHAPSPVDHDGPNASDTILTGDVGDNAEAAGRDDDNATSTSTTSEDVLDGVAGPNPFYTGRLADAEVLPGVFALTLGWSPYGNSLMDVEVLDIDRFHRPKVAFRILQISNHQDANTITLPPGGIFNMAVADPELFKSINGFVGSIEHKSFIIGSLTGVTTHFQNDPPNMCQICIKPFFHSWPRFAAVLGQIFGNDRLHFRTWKNGVVFSTSVGNIRGPRLYPNANNKAHAPILGANLPAGDKIPVYDGRGKFSLAKYWTEAYKGTVRAGSTVMVLFSMKQNKMRKDLEVVGIHDVITVYLNIVGVVVLAEPVDVFCTGESPDPLTVRGVDQLRMASDLNAGQDDDSSDEDAGQGEVF